MKSPLTHLAAIALIALAFSIRAPAAESPSVLLQKGIYAEETEGNVDAAIKIYQQIAAEAATNRAIVAQAQYRLAVCYQKKGNREQAIKVLGELVQQFPSDASVIQKARATLTELGATTPEAVTVRQLPLSMATEWIMSVSLDGRFIAYQAKGNGDYFVCEVATGKTWLIAKDTKGKGWWGAKLSPDGQQIVYQTTGSSVYLTKNDGSETRTLYSTDGINEQFTVLGWSSDGSHVNLGIWDPKGRAGFETLVGIDAKTGARKETARLSVGEKKDDWHPSENGQYVARRRGMYPRTVVLVDLKSGREEMVVDRDAGEIFGWFEGDTKFLYSKVRSGGLDLWAMNLKEGRPLGEPELVWSFRSRAEPVGITRDGSVYFTPDHESLWVMEGFLSKRTSPARTGMLVEIPEDEIVGPNHSILIREFGLSATPPAGWTIKGAGRSAGGDSLIQFIVPDAPNAIPVINYHASTPGKFPADSQFLSWTNLLGPKPITPAEVDSWLRNYAQRMGAEDRMKQGKAYASYENRSASIVLRNIGGNRAVSWMADFTRASGDKEWTECLTLIYSEKVVARFRIQATKETIEAIRPAFESLVASVRLP